MERAEISVFHVQNSRRIAVERYDESTNSRLVTQPSVKAPVVCRTRQSDCLTHWDHLKEWLLMISNRAYVNYCFVFYTLMKMNDEIAYFTVRWKTKQKPLVVLIARLKTNS